MQIKDGFIEHAEKHTDLLRNIIEAAKECNFTADSKNTFAQDVLSLIADENDDYEPEARNEEPVDKWGYEQNKADDEHSNGGES